MNKELPPLENITTVNGVDYFHELTQSSEEWHQLRYGMITASNIDKILTPTLKIANNKDTRTFVYELAAERLVKLPIENYISWDMERGKLEEIEARIKYSKEYEEAKECGFVINKKLGFPVGFSPDGLVGEAGIIEVKSRKPKYQVQTILEHIVQKEAAKTPIPIEFMLQVQSSLWITGREWCDFISYSNGFNMTVIRCEPDPVYQAAIEEAIEAAEYQIKTITKDVREKMIDSDNIKRVNWINHHEEMTA